MNAFGVKEVFVAFYDFLMIPQFIEASFFTLKP